MRHRDQSELPETILETTPAVAATQGNPPPPALARTANRDRFSALRFGTTACRRAPCWPAIPQASPCPTFGGTVPHPRRANQQRNGCSHLNALTVEFRREGARVRLAFGREFAGLVFVAVQVINPNPVEHFQIPLT